MTTNKEPETEEAIEDRGDDLMARITGTGTSLLRSLMLPGLALVTALLIGAVIIALSDIDNLPRLFSEPGAALSSMGTEIIDSYRALFRGSIGSVAALSETLFAATPLILASLGVALGFQAGLFNIGAQGQMLIGGILATWVGIYLSLPAVLHIPLALIGGLIGGVIWGGIPGLLKARTGAHEVITTIMFNFIALFFVQWLLTIPLFQEPGRNNPVSAPLESSATLPGMFGSSYRVTIGFLVALAAVYAVYWLLYKSQIGFEFRAVGKNQAASLYAGMNVSILVTMSMGVAGALAGLAGANQVMGLEPYKATTALAGSVGFDAITVALLGRSHPVGTLWAALLFGALKAGGREMQGAVQIPLDLVVVLQALIVIFVAAPEMVKAIYRMRHEGGEETTQLTTGWGA